MEMGRHARLASEDIGSGEVVGNTLAVASERALDRTEGDHVHRDLKVTRLTRENSTAGYGRLEDTDAPSSVRPP